MRQPTTNMEDTGSPLGDRKIKETMYKMVSRILGEIDQWRENSSTDDTLKSLTSIETFLEEIKEIYFAILREEEEAATEFPSILRLLIKKIKIAGNNPQTRWYDVMTLRPPPLPKNEEKHRECGNGKSNDLTWYAKCARPGPESTQLGNFRSGSSLFGIPG